MAWRLKEGWINSVPGRSTFGRWLISVDNFVLHISHPTTDKSKTFNVDSCAPQWL